MNTITRMGTFDAVVKGATKDVGEICWALRALIAGLHPDSLEVPRPGEPSSAYGFGEKKMSEAYAYIMPQKTHANLGFYHGAAIARQHPLLEGTGKSLRHVKVRSVAIAQSEEIKAVLLAAIEERRTALGL